MDTTIALMASACISELIVALIVSAVNRAYDLATAMESRCYHGGEGRTRMKQLRFQTADFAALGLGAVFLALVLILRKLGL